LLFKEQPFFVDPFQPDETVAKQQSRLLSGLRLNISKVLQRRVSLDFILLQWSQISVFSGLISLWVGGVLS